MDARTTPQLAACCQPIRELSSVARGRVMGSVHRARPTVTRGHATIQQDSVYLQISTSRARPPSATRLNKEQVLAQYPLVVSRPESM
jgi:hypothetical protein